MVIVKARVDSSQTRFSPTMTLYFTMILGYCRVQLKKIKNGRHVTRFRGADPTQPSAGHQVMELVHLG